MELLAAIEKVPVRREELLSLVFLTVPTKILEGYLAFTSEDPGKGPVRETSSLRGEAHMPQVLFPSRPAPFSTERAG